MAWANPVIGTKRPALAKCTHLSKNLKQVSKQPIKIRVIIINVPACFVDISKFFA